DCRRHLRGYVLPTLGDHILADLSARDILGLRSELRQRLSLKLVKNILAGSLKAMLRDARIIDHALDHDPSRSAAYRAAAGNGPHTGGDPARAPGSGDLPHCES